MLEVFQQLFYSQQFNRMAVRNLRGKRILITGASSGIGRHLAIQLTRHGAQVLACARRGEKLALLEADVVTLLGPKPRRPQQENGDTNVAAVGSGRLKTCVADVTSVVDRERLIANCQTHFGGLDILINNAGVGAMGRFDQADQKRMRDVFEVNFFSLVEMTRISLPVLKSGHDPMIVNISSVLGHRGAPLKSEYSASKFAVHGFSDAIRAELATDGVEVLLVSPSTTDSEFFDAALEDDTRKDWKKRGAMPPAIVATKTIRAMEKRRHEIILTFGGRILVWLDRMIPGLANRLMAKFGQ